MLFSDFNEGTILMLGGDKIAFALKWAKVDLLDDLNSIGVRHIDLFVDIAFDRARFGKAGPVGEGHELRLAIIVESLWAIRLDT